MEFKKELSGYNREEVDVYIAELKREYQGLMMELKQRVVELRDENANLTAELGGYKAKCELINDTLIKSNALAHQITEQSEIKSRQILIEATNRAKQLTKQATERLSGEVDKASIFATAWQLYAQRIVHQLSAEQLKEFNELSSQILSLTQQASTLVNPIDKVTGSLDVGDKQTGSSDNKSTLDMREMLAVTDSLEKLCDDLGIK